VAKPTRRPGIARNAAANWLAFGFVAGVSFFLAPFVVSRLGATAYGVWSLLVAVVGYLGLLDFGVRGAVTRYVAHHYAAGDDQGSSSIVSAAMVLFGLLGCVAILLASVLAFLAPAVFNIPESLADDTRIVLIIGGLTVAVTLVGAVFGGIVTGLERFDINSGIEILLTAIRAIAVVIALREGYGLVALGCIHLAISIVYGLAAWAAARRLYPALRLRFRVSLLPHIRTILSFSLALSALHITTMVIYYSDTMVIAAFLPIGAVTFFVIAGNLCDYAYKVAAALSTLMTPRVSALASAGSKNIGEDILGTARVATLASASIAATFWFRGESFINLWMGADYGPQSGEVLRILAFVVWLGAARSVAASSIMGVNKHRALIPAFAFEALCNVVLSVALVKPLGLIGVALGTLIPSMLVTLGYIPRCLSQSVGVPVTLFFRRAWIVPTVACLPFAVASIALEHYFPATNLAIFFAQVMLTLPLVLVGAILLCLTAAEKERLRLVTKEWLRKRSDVRRSRR